jgi:hypothetical protein
VGGAELNTCVVLYDDGDSFDADGRYSDTQKLSRPLDRIICSPLALVFRISFPSPSL